jgi:cobalt-zinc-cadmium efflux system protein
MAYVLFNVFRNVGTSFRIFLQGTPAHISPTEIEKDLLALEGVVGIHDLHLWTLDGQYNVATLHIVVSGPMDLVQMEAVKQRVRHALQHLHIEHATIEIEDESVDCELGDCADHTHIGKAPGQSDLQVIVEDAHSHHDH